MEILIDVNGETYSLPSTGESIRTSNPRATVRYAGKRGTVEARAQRVLDCVPKEPRSITITEIGKVLDDVSHDTIARILKNAEEEGRLRSWVPRPTRRGRVARLWTRA